VNTEKVALLQRLQRLETSSPVLRRATATTTTTTGCGHKAGSRRRGSHGKGGCKRRGAER